MTVVESDMRAWSAPEKADVLVSELLGSWGDNELSPECLDGAQCLLKSEPVLARPGMSQLPRSIRREHSQVVHELRGAHHLCSPLVAAQGGP